MTVSRCTTWSATTTSTTRPTARTIATASTRTTAGTAASRARPTIRRCCELRAPPEAQPAGDAAAVAGRADAAGRRRDGQHPARQQQRLLPGQRDRLDQVGPGRSRAAGVRPAADPAAPRAIRSSAAPTSSAAARIPGTVGQATSSGSTPRAASSATRTGTSRKPAAWASCWAATPASCSTPPAAGRSSTTASSC